MNSPASTVRGLARMVQVAPQLTIIDLALQGHPEGNYFASIRENGDISKGAASTGRIWEDEEGKQRRGNLGEFKVDKYGKGSVYIDSKVDIWELIGRSMVVTPHNAEILEGHDDKTVVGVIARSAGVWENEKTVRLCYPKQLP